MRWPTLLAEMLQELLADIRGCCICAGNLPLGPRPVLQVAASARLLVVGQAPSKLVHNSGIPWNDASGIQLRHWLGLERERFYDDRDVAIVPMGFCYPGTGESGDLPPREECSQTWHPRLLPLLPNVRLTLLIGHYAQRYMLQDRRGKTLTDTVRAYASHLPAYLPLPHPSPRNRLWLRNNPWFEDEVLPVLRARVAEALAD